MKSIIKSRLFLFIICAIFFTGFGALAASLNAREINYKDNKSVADAIDDLYSAAENYDCVKGTFTCTSCNTQEGQELNLGFEPSIMYIHSYDFSRYIAFNTNINATKTYYYSNGAGSANLTSWFTFDNDIILHSFSTAWKNINYQ